LITGGSFGAVATTSIETACTARPPRPSEAVIENAWLPS
jgi:hypothetical protein